MEISKPKSAEIIYKKAKFYVENAYIVINLDPMNQSHNNKNGQIWQEKEKEGTKNLKSNTGRSNCMGAYQERTIHG